MSLDHPLPDAPILIFDSGIGGLSIVEPLRALLPYAPIVYAADTAAFPYGNKSEDEIASRIPALLGRMVERYHPRLVVIACNTASTIALSTVRAALDVGVVGTVPAIKPAAIMTKTGVIGIVGTEATIRQPYIDNLMREFGKNVKLLRTGAPDLVLAAEAKLRGEPSDVSIIKRSIAGLFDQKRADEIDTVILACTHFPLLEDELRTAIGREVTFVHGGDGIARRIDALTKDPKWPNHVSAGPMIVTGDPEVMSPYLPELLRYGIDRIEKL